MAPRYAGPQTKEMGFAHGARGLCGTQSGTLSPDRQMVQAAGNTHRESHAGTRRQGQHQRAQGLTRPGGGAHARSGSSPGRAGTPRWEAGAPAPAQPLLTGVGSAAAAALSARALPEPGRACAAAPQRRRRRRRRRRLLCSSGSNSGRHGQVQRGAHPRAARQHPEVPEPRGCAPTNRVKLEMKPKKFEDRVLAVTSWRLHLFPLKVPAKVESSFNVLEIRAFNTLSQNQILVETERGMVSMRLPSAESVDQVTRHVSSALSKVCPGPGCLIRRGNADTPEGPRDTSPNSETSTSTTHSVCGGFSETYAALCDYNGLHCREEVQWP
ncbi:uncharacterized protein [Saccopteryx bilineata]|uniref:uncharacterized protein n=1 Tax=Saccopteryx bilineata TaxID=59482 RepID=UPI00338D44E7